MDFGFVHDGDVPSTTSGCVELQLPKDEEAKRGRRVESREEGEKEDEERTVEVRYYNGAGICLGRRKIVVE